MKSWPLSDAQRVASDVDKTLEDRQGKYGHPADHFRRTVALLNAYGVVIIRDGEVRPVSATDWPIFMIFDKIARDQGPEPDPDNTHDIAGYARCRQMVIDRMYSPRRSDWNDDDV